MHHDYLLVSSFLYMEVLILGVCHILVHGYVFFKLCLMDSEAVDYKIRFR